jgi:hypothetical protein
MFWVILFIIWGMRDLIDAKPLSMDNDFINLEEDIRKKYRFRRAICYFFISAVAACDFVAETIFHIRLNFGSALIYLGIPYAGAVLYLIYLKRKYHVPSIFSRKNKN